MRGSIVGLPETFGSGNTTYYSILTVLDLLFSALIVSPCVVCYWRSVWNLMDIFVAPENELLSAVISTAIGICGHLFFTLFQKVFEEHFHPEKNRILFYLVSRFYTVCYAFTCVNGWRGPWMILSLRSKVELLGLIATTSVGLVALIAMRALRNVSAPPCVIVNDTVKGYFEVQTMFRISIHEKTSLFILDCLFSVLIVGTLVVFVWRGLWVLTDILIFPEDEIISAWASLALGYGVVAIVFMLQPLMRRLCAKLTGASKLFAADFFIIFSLVGTINVWRGTWNLVNIYFLPENLELSSWITHWASLILLILLGCSNSLLVRGVYIDAEEPEGKCVVFPCYYLRLIFQEEKQKKITLESGKTEGYSEKAIESNHVTVSTVAYTVEEKSRENTT